MKFHPPDARSPKIDLDRGTKSGRGLRLLSYNIQAGIDTRHYREYVTKGWKHLLPNRERLKNLNLIADMLHGYDLVGLQEVDSGSLRSGFVDMTEYLAHRSGYPHWYRQVNRNMGVLGQHSNGFLSRYRPTRVSNHRLPPWRDVARVWRRARGPSRLQHAPWAESEGANPSTRFHQ